MSALERIHQMPDWPARMTADVACAYMCVSKTTFLTRFGRIGVKEGGNVFWSRAQLDRLVAKQFALTQPRSPLGDEDTSWDDFH